MSVEETRDHIHLRVTGLQGISVQSRRVLVLLAKMINAVDDEIHGRLRGILKI